MRSSLTSFWGYNQPRRAALRRLLITLRIATFRFGPAVGRRSEATRRGLRWRDPVTSCAIPAEEAVVVIAVLVVLGNQIQNAFCNISGAIGQ